MQKVLVGFYFRWSLRRFQGGSSVNGYLVLEEALVVI